MIETNIDDVTGEILGFVMEKLLKISLDVFYTPIFMKKNRPAYKLSVLCDEAFEDKILEIIFRHTTTIGVRKYSVDRVILERETIKFKSSLGLAQVKCAKYKEEEYIYPEYEFVKKISDENNLPIMEVYRRIINEYEKKSKCNL